MPELTVLYDNYSVTGNTVADWGFSCQIQGFDQTILFDTGADAEILARNAVALGIDLRAIETVVISHNHWDHTGGLDWVLKVNYRPRVFCPSVVSNELRGIISNAGAYLIQVDAPLEICENVWLTGAMGEGTLTEQALILTGRKGTAVITGCSHPGIVEIVKRVKQIAPGDIHLALGGFHLKGHSEAEVREIARALKAAGVQTVSPSHCTGTEAIALFAEHFRDNYFKIGTGYSLVF